MNLRGIDLNLLVVLDALLREAHVSRAAAALAMSQPATSNALERCRKLFDDPLLERGDGGMRLTAKAQSLREPITELLARAEHICDIRQPPLGEVRGKVRIIMADVLGAVIAPELQAEVTKAAPGIDLVLLPWRPATDSVAALIKGKADIAVSMLPRTSDELHVEDVLYEDYVVAMRAEHPAAKQFDLETWLAWPHILVSPEGGTRGSVDDPLDRIGRGRRVSMVVPSFLMVPDILRASDMIGFLPTICARGDRCRGLAIHQPPISLDGFMLQIGWHRQRGRAAPIRFVADHVRAICGHLEAGNVHQAVRQVAKPVAPIPDR